MSICFVDTETTGLHPDKHQIWEVALITPNGDEHVWQFPVASETDCDPFALDIGHYWDRKWTVPIVRTIDPLDAIYKAHTEKARYRNFPERGVPITAGNMLTWCEHFRDLTAGHHLCGAVVSFDEERLRRLLWRHDLLPRWHYHLIDVEALAIGYLAGMDENLTPNLVPPWKSDQLTEALGITVAEEDKHTALGDARWAKAIYEQVMG